MIDRNRSFKRLVPLSMATLLLVGIGAERLQFRAAPKNADEYHAQVAAAAKSFPMAIGNWVGIEASMPPAAVSLLRPNVIVSRRYENLSTGRSFRFVLVQCRDARDMLGHYPPACYPAQGWQQAASNPADWCVGDSVVRGMSYRFLGFHGATPEELNVENFFVLPDGNFGRDMDAVEQCARTARTKFFGAAQIQFVFDTSFSAAERSDVVVQFVSADRLLLQTIRNGSVNQ